MTYLYPDRSSPDLFSTAPPSARLRWQFYEKSRPHSSINVSNKAFLEKAVRQ